MQNSYYVMLFIYFILFCYVMNVYCVILFYILLMLCYVINFAYPEFILCYVILRIIQPIGILANFIDIFS